MCLVSTAIRTYELREKNGVTSNDFKETYCIHMDISVECRTNVDNDYKFEEK